MYAKGSARKRWDSPLDYVPELSDVDVHVLFADDESVSRHLLSLEVGLRIQRLLEEGYARRVPAPLHVPRVQMIIANVLHRQPDFFPSVPHTVDTLFGVPYSQPVVDFARSRAVARSQLLSSDEYLAGLGGAVADKTGQHLWEIFRAMNWRVGPTGPRVLEVRGVPFLDAWGVNRTAIFRMLRDIGEQKLAAAYAAYYLNGWAYFLSGHQDSEAARQAILAGSRVLIGGAAVAAEME